MVTRWQPGGQRRRPGGRARRRLKLDPYEVLIVASLLQAEVQPKDFAKVARVIYNRLDAGMPLQLDTTVLYALGRIGYEPDARGPADQLAVQHLHAQGPARRPRSTARGRRPSTRRCTRPRATGSTT